MAAHGSICWWKYVEIVMNNCGERQTFFYLVHTTSSGMVSGIYSLRHCLKEHWLAQTTDAWSGTMLIRELDECRSRLKLVLWPCFIYYKDACYRASRTQRWEMDRGVGCRQEIVQRVSLMFTNKERK